VTRKVLSALGLGLAALLFVIGRADAIPTELEGQAGGGLTPWAILAPSAPLVSYTNLQTNDYKFQNIAIGGTLWKRLELSYSAQLLDAPTVGTALTLDERINQTVIGAKYKLLDAGAKNAVPAISVGLQLKSASGSILDALKAGGAITSTSGTDFYVAATKIFGYRGTNLVLNGTLRATKANQFGLLGFGGGTNGHDSYSIEPEFSAGAFVADNVAIGGEYRFRPNNISSSAFGIKEGGAQDLWIVFLPNPHYAVTAAYVDLGQVGPSRKAVPAIGSTQDGLYLQLQANF
jgi:hypothetical protein